MRAGFFVFTVYDHACYEAFMDCLHTFIKVDTSMDSCTGYLFLLFFYSQPDCTLYLIHLDFRGFLLFNVF